MKIVVPVIAVDGPSGAGKGTLCKIMAETLKWHYLDSGAIYRLLAMIALHNHVDIASEKALVLLATNLDMYFISINGILELKFEGDINDKIRSAEIANTASQIAIFPRVRKALLRYQHSFRQKPGLIADGRDTGSVIFPDALIKIFFNASPEERAKRRMFQLQKMGCNVSFAHLLSEIKERDERDYNRINAPLFPAKGALILDSTNLTIEQAAEKALQYSRQKLTLMSLR